MATRSPKISVIIPVYNNETYIGSTLDSLLAQSFRDFEAIIVNDGSTDGSADIIRSYATRDQRIRFIERDHMGVSAARNAGLGLAAGEFCTFLDSDDLLPPDAYETMYRAAGGNDLVVGIYERLEGLRVHTNKRTSALSQKTDIRPWDPDLIHSFEVWNKLFRMDIINEYDIMFEDFMYLSDVIFTYTFLQHTDKIACTDKVVYRYCRRLSIYVPVATPEINAHKIEDAVRASSRLFEITAQWPEEFRDEMEYRIINAVYIRTFYRHIWDLNEETSERLTGIINASLPRIDDERRERVASKCADLGIDGGFRSQSEILEDPLFTVYITGDVSAENVNDLLASLFGQNCPNFRCVLDSALAFAVDDKYLDKGNLTLGLTRTLPDSPYVLYCDCNMMLDSDTLAESYKSLQKTGADMAVVIAVDIDGEKIAGFDGAMGNKIIRTQALRDENFSFKWADARKLEKNMKCVHINDQAIILR